MGTNVQGRNYTARGQGALTPWIDPTYKYSLYQLYLGSNFISSLEIVSSLNCLNLARWQYAYEAGSRTSRFYPKLYLSTVQSVSFQWNYDVQGNPNFDQKQGEKSGSLIN